HRPHGLAYARETEHQIEREHGADAHHKNKDVQMGQESIADHDRIGRYQGRQGAGRVTQPRLANGALQDIGQTQGGNHQLYRHAPGFDDFFHDDALEKRSNQRNSDQGDGDHQPIGPVQHQYHEQGDVSAHHEYFTLRKV